MVKGFADYTAPLSDYELNVVVPKVADILKPRKGAALAITNKGIRELLQFEGVEITDSRVRAVLNHIRTNHIVRRILAGSNGYYIGTTAREVEDYARSLAERCASITQVRMALLDDLQGSLFFN